MKAPRNWRNRLAMELILCSICVLVLSPLIVQASLPVPQVKVLPIWQEVAEVHRSGWLGSDDRWYHGEMGILKTIEQGALVRDLAKGGWKKVRVDADSPDRPLAELLDILPELEEAKSSPILHIQASQGPWELAVFAAKDKSEGYYDHEYDYFAILSHKPDLKAPLHEILAKEYQIVPGSRLARAIIPTDGSDEQGIYFFLTTSPIEAVVAHYARQPDWQVQSLGILGALGYNEKTGSILTVLGSDHSLDDQEELGEGEIKTCYVIAQGSRQTEEPWGW